MSRRYVVTQTPDQRHWAILDRELMGFCTLPDGHGNLLPLEWHGKPAAEAWLYACRVVWGNGLVPAPEGWNEFKAEPSPWDRGWSYYN